MSFSELIAAQYAYQIVQYPEHAIGYTTFALERARSPNFIHE